MRILVGGSWDAVWFPLGTTADLQSSAFHLFSRKLNIRSRPHAHIHHSSSSLNRLEGRWSASVPIAVGHAVGVNGCMAMDSAVYMGWYSQGGGLTSIKLPPRNPVRFSQEARLRIHPFQCTRRSIVMSSTSTRRLGSRQVISAERFLSLQTTTGSASPLPCAFRRLDSTPLLAK